MNWFPKFTVRTFALICVAVTSGYVMWLGNKIINTLSGPGWCATALGAGKATGGSAPVKGLEACVGLLTVQLKSLSINSHILLGTIALSLGVLIIITVAGAKFSGSVDEHGAKLDMARDRPPLPVHIENKPSDPVPVKPAEEATPEKKRKGNVMTILIFAIVIVILAFLLCYAVDQAQMAPPMNSIPKVVIILLAIIVIANKAGLV